MRYLELVLYAFARLVIWYSVILLLGIVAIEVATCPPQNRFVTMSGAGQSTYATGMAVSLGPMQFFGSIVIRAEETDETYSSNWELYGCGGKPAFP